MIENLEEQIIYTCRFCNPPERDRIIYESDNFYIMLSLGPIVEGYCLLVSKQHISCCGGIPSQLRKEFESLYSRLKAILIKTYGSCVCYEHGRAGSCMVQLEGNKHCYHAHMHFVPISTSLNYIAQKDFDEKSLKTLNELFSVYEKMERPPYVFIDDEEIGMNIYHVDQQIRRQYLRYHAAKSIGKEHLWNWVEHQGWDLIELGIKTLKPHFNNV
jgi:diadenosine tetraphosphate (Ap4A) HIT family hydrolase